MRIRFVTLYFPPEVGAAQRRISELARRLAMLGHRVTVVTGFPNYPSGIKPQGYGGKLIMKETLDGYNIIRLPHYVAPNKGFAKRLMIHLSFALSATVYSLFMKTDDVVYIESPPLFNGFIGLITKWFRRLPYVFNVADLWPQTAIELGALKNKRLISLAQALEKLCYNNAARVLAVTVGIKSFIENMGYHPEKVALLTNGVDHTIFTDSVTPHPEILKHKRDGRLLAIYAGTHGMAHALHVIIEAAARLKDEKIDFLFIGSGPEKQSLVARVAEYGLTNAIFMEPMLSAEMPAVLRAADLALIPLRDLPLFDSAMPSKCFEAMAAGLPILLAVRGEMTTHIRTADCGICVEPENLDEIVEALKEFISFDTVRRTEMGRRGRDFVVRHFSREVITRNLESLLNEITTDDS